MILTIQKESIVSEDKVDIDVNVTPPHACSTIVAISELAELALEYVHAKVPNRPVAQQEMAIASAKKFANCLSKLERRYARLGFEVLTRMPLRWDCGPTDDDPYRCPVYWDMFSTDTLLLNNDDRAFAVASAGPIGPAFYRPDKQFWHITLNRFMLGWYSDPAVKWVLAHEFAHVNSRNQRTHQQLFDGRIVYGAAYERNESLTDNMALDWGFQSEKDAFDSEQGPPDSLLAELAALVA
jgi:hypothetical protein